MRTLYNTNCQLPFYSVNKFDNSVNSVKSNISESDEMFRIELSLAGFDKSEIKIKLDENHLVVNSDLSDKEKDEQKYLRKDFVKGEFEKKFYIPNKLVDYEKISSELNNGVLVITLPKAEKEPEKYIAVN